MTAPTPGLRARAARHFGPSIARRFATTMVLSYLIAWTLVYAIARLNMYAESYGEFDTGLTSIGQSVQRTLDSGHGTEALVGLTMWMEADRRQLNLPPGYARFEVRDAEGRLFARSQEAPAGEALPATPREGLFNVDITHEPVRVMRTWTRDHRYRIDVVQSLSARQWAFVTAVFNNASLVQLALALPVLLLPTWLAVRTGLRPLRRLSQTLAARLPGDLSPIGFTPPHSELAPVVRELDVTLARLNALLERERAFLADAAHELRTPLAVVAAQVDALLHETDRTERDRAAHRLAGGVGRSMRLVNQLLALARLESHGAPAVEAVDLADLARDGLAMLAPEAEQRSVDIAYVGPDSLPGHGPRAAIESALGNLVVNAIRHGGSPGRVEVRLARATGIVTLSVQDDGPGIPEGERQRVFDRFVRGRAATAPGSGLGMSIVESAARQLGARIELDAGLGGQGLSVTLTWPWP